MAHTAGQNTRENPRRNKRTKAEDNLTPSKHKKTRRKAGTRRKIPPTSMGLFLPIFRTSVWALKKRVFGEMLHPTGQRRQLKMARGFIAAKYENYQEL